MHQSGRWPMCRVFATGLGDWGSIRRHVIPKTQKMILDTALLNTQQYKVRIKGKVEQSKEWSSTLPYTLVVVAIEKGAFGSPSTKGRQLYFFYLYASMYMVFPNFPGLKTILHIRSKRSSVMFSRRILLVVLS